MSLCTSSRAAWPAQASKQAAGLVSNDAHEGTHASKANALAHDAMYEQLCEDVASQGQAQAARAGPELPWRSVILIILLQGTCRGPPLLVVSNEAVGEQRSGAGRCSVQVPLMGEASMTRGWWSSVPDGPR